MKMKNFKFNYDNLSPNTLYFFPDPSLIGINGDVLIFNVDDSYLKKNASKSRWTAYIKGFPSVLVQQKYITTINKLEELT